MCRPCRGWRRTSRFFPTAAPATSLRARVGTRSRCARRGKGAGKMPAVRGGCTGAMRRDGDFRFEIGDFRGSGTTGPKGRHPAESREEESTEKAPEGFLAALGMTRGESSRGIPRPPPFGFAQGKRRTRNGAGGTAGGAVPFPLAALEKRPRLFCSRRETLQGAKDAGHHAFGYSVVLKERPAGPRRHGVDGPRRRGKG